jgi:hypothetical protein
VADAHETWDEAFVERSETFCPVDRLHGVEGMLVAFLTVRDGLSLWGAKGRRHVSEVGDPRGRKGGRAMKRVLMTHSGLVTIVPVAPAVMAAVMCNQIELGGCSAVKREARRRVRGQSEGYVSQREHGRQKVLTCAWVRFRVVSQLCLYGVVNGEVDCPSREVAEHSRS